MFEEAGSNRIVGFCVHQDGYGGGLDENNAINKITNDKFLVL